jgi:hypothetical protein
MRVSRETLGAALVLLLTGPAASGATVSGSAALALAALVARQSPELTRYEKRIMALLFDGRLDFTFASGKEIAVDADAVTCRASNVDITLHSCDLSFGKSKAVLDGPIAQQLFATLIVAGVPSEGAAGSLFAGVDHLACTIDPNAAKQRAGGGAQCQFAAGSP